MKYYIIIVNPAMHQHEWETMKRIFKASGFSYVVYFDYTITELECNNVSEHVFKEMHYEMN